MLYNDQMHIMAKHITQVYQTTPSTTDAAVIHTMSTAHIQDDSACHADPRPPRISQLKDPAISEEELVKFFTLQQLKVRQDWPQWQEARYKMLDNYQEQEMFGPPMQPPKGVNIHHMLWRCMIKMCRTRKACMVCDGAPKQGTIKLGYTFANSVDAGSERLFWEIAAQKGLKVFRADCSNAFVEAPPPQHPLSCGLMKPTRNGGNITYSKALSQSTVLS
jgi:hypothetical protein